MRGRKDGGLSVSTCAVAMVQGCRTRAVWLLLGLCLVHVPRSSTFFASLAPMARRGEAGGPRPERLRLDSVPTWGSHPLYQQAGRAPAPSCAWNWWWSPKWPNLAVALNQAASGGDGPREEGAKEVVRANDLSDTEAVTFFEAPELTMRDIATMTVPQLKEELRERGLRVGGKKDELLQRLQDAIDGKITAPVTTLRGGRASGKSRAASAGNSAKVKVGSGSGIRLAEGERLPVAPPMEKVMQMDSSVRRIFVRGLPFRASPRDVASILEDAFGRVESLEGMTLSGRSTGRAWVTFEHASTAMEAVAEHTIELDGRPIHFSPPWSLASRQALREMAEVVPCYVYILGCNLLCYILGVAGDGRGRPVLLSAMCTHPVPGTYQAYICLHTRRSPITKPSCVRRRRRQQRVRWRVTTAQSRPTTRPRRAALTRTGRTPARSRVDGRCLWGGSRRMRQRRTW